MGKGFPNMDGSEIFLETTINQDTPKEVAFWDHM